jgi:hypothetical protein
MSKVYGVNVDMRNPYRILIGKCEGKRLYGNMGGII